MFFSVVGEQMDPRDATATPYDESPYETGDSDVDPNYSLIDDSYSDTSEGSSSSLHEVNVCALNEPQNVDLTTERENGNQRVEKESFKRGTEVPDRKIRPFVGPLVDRNKFCEQETIDISKYIDLSAISVPKETSYRIQ
jgi:hypothetical protein